MVKIKAMGGLLLTLQAGTLDDKTFLEICRRTGRLKDFMDRLLHLDRIDQAAAEAIQAGDYELLGLADLRSKTLESLAHKGNHNLLTRIFLEEGEIDQAIESLERTKGGGYGYSLQVEMAQTVSQQRPKEAIPTKYRCPVQWILLAQKGGRNLNYCLGNLPKA